MAEIKRPNYFTSQFLVEKDFTDEQAYHVGMRRRHERVLHTPGVADGFAITPASATEVSIAPGTAIDSAGREIVLDDALTYKLSTAGNGLEVFLTIAYQEVFDQADHDTQSGLDKFVRTTERPKLQDGTAIPPADGSVIVLAKISLNNTNGAIASVDTTVRTIAGARLAPGSVVTGNIADGAVTPGKLAPEAQATAVLVDTRGGLNRIVTQINAGTGVIANARLEPDVMTGVVTFNNLLLNLEQFSNDIDPGLGAGPLFVYFGIEDVVATGFTTSGDTGYARGINVRADVNRANGHFGIVARRVSGSPGPASIRWYAFKTRPGQNSSIDVSVSVTPPAPMAGNASQVLTAHSNNSFPSDVTWAIVNPTADSGSLTGATGTTVTYNSSIKTGDYSVKATSVVDPSKSTTVTVSVTGAITVILSQETASIFTNGTITLNASVINTATTGINWQIANGAGGTLSQATGPTTTFTPPGVGTFVINAISAIDSNVKKGCTVTVTAVSVTATPSASQVLSNGQVLLTATVTPAGASPLVDWTVTAGSVNPTRGSQTFFTPPASNVLVTASAKSVTDPSKTGACTVNVGVVNVNLSAGSQTISHNGATTITASVSPAFASPNVTFQLISGAGFVTNATGTSITYNAPGGTATTATIRATSVADNTKTRDIAITVLSPPPPPPPPPPPGGKFIVDPIAPEISLGPDESPAAKADTASAAKKPRVFLTPKKKGKPDPA